MLIYFYAYIGCRAIHFVLLLLIKRLNYIAILWKESNCYCRASWVKAKITASSTYSNIGTMRSSILGVFSGFLIVCLKSVVRMDMIKLNSAGERVSPYFTPLIDQIGGIRVDHTLTKAKHHCTIFFKWWQSHWESWP